MLYFSLIFVRFSCRYLLPSFFLFMEFKVRLVISRNLLILIRLVEIWFLILFCLQIMEICELLFLFQNLVICINQRHLRWYCVQLIYRRYCIRFIRYPYNLCWQIGLFFLWFVLDSLDFCNSNEYQYLWLVSYMMGRKVGLKLNFHRFWIL